MSYTIYKSFNVKNGKASSYAAESNLFDVSYDRRGRQHESLIFNRHIKDFEVNEMTQTLSNGEQVDNRWFGMTDMEIYTYWMLTSVYCGDKYYEAKHKAVLAVIGDWVKQKQEEDLTAFIKDKGLTREKWDAMDWGEQRKLGYNEYRIYNDPTKEELKELEKLVVECLEGFKLRKRTIVITVRNGDEEYVQSVSSKGYRTTTTSRPPTKPTYFCLNDIKRLAKIWGNIKVYDSKGNLEDLDSLLK